MLNEQTIIVTGGSSGMGFHMAQKFAQEGANVVITGRDMEKLNEALTELSGLRGKVEVFQMDVREPEHAKAMVNFAHEKFGRIDGLVNNAAGNFIVHAEKLSPNGWRSVIDIVLNGTFFCSHAVGNYWIENGTKGNILNMLATYAWNAGAGCQRTAALLQKLVSCR